jgi:hypothetical protein
VVAAVVGEVAALSRRGGREVEVVGAFKWQVAGYMQFNGFTHRLIDGYYNDMLYRAVMTTNITSYFYKLLKLEGKHVCYSFFWLFVSIKL